MPYGDRRLYGVCCAEKGTFRFAVRARGKAGHASVPGIGDNALLKLAPVLERLGARQPAYDVTEEPRASCARRSARTRTTRRARVARLREVEPRLAAMFEPTLRRHGRADDHLGVARRSTSSPPAPSCRVDCRVPPGMGGEATMARIREAARRRSTASRSSSSSRSSATARRSTRR